MGENDTTKQGVPLATGQPSDGKGGSTSQQPPPKTFTSEELQKFVSDALAEQGRRHKAELTPVIKERDSLKSQTDSLTSQIEDKNTELEKIQTQLEELSSDDPKKFDLLKLDKELRADRSKLKAERTSLDTDKQAHSEVIQEARDYKRTATIVDIVTEYENGDFAKLADLCEIAKVDSEEGIRTIADRMFSKKVIIPAKTETSPPLVVDPGGTHGGVSDRYTAKQIQSMSPKEITALQAKYNKTLMQLIAEGVIVEK